MVVRRHSSASTCRFIEVLLRRLRVERNLGGRLEETCLLGISRQVILQPQAERLCHAPYLILSAIDFFQINANRILSRLIDGDVADSVGRKVGMAILVIWNLVFPKAARIISAWDWDMS